MPTLTAAAEAITEGVKILETYPATLLAAAAYIFYYFNFYLIKFI